MTRPLRIGILGCADIARRRMLPAMAGNPDVEPAAVASRSAATARETARPFGCRPVHGYDVLLARHDIDAVYIPLPAALHEQWTERALHAGKHVLAEKPLTLDAERTRALARLAARHGLVLMENVMFVHHAQHRTVRELVEQGAIGRLHSLRATFAVPRLPPGNIRLRADLGGGALWDTGVYPVRAALYFLGGDLRVTGATLTSDPDHAVDIAGTALLHSPRRVTAQLAFGLDHGYRSTYELWGSEGRITVDRAFTPPADHRPQVRLERATTTEHLPLEADDQVANTLAAFAHAVRTHSTTDPASLHQADLLQTIRHQAVRL
ncbi:Gfo/Idh/MocA family protein [Streptomyces mutabilis]|uniref:Gfo/Idh/MocA family protein n=1 Tax=Streptomyces mutabilis TaxID=67332 RepID=UPI000A9A30FE|nr:Gfo/Idh/MocA family oxidoreductase [Streptomyces mutabilis]